MSDEQKKNGGSKQPLSFRIAFFANVLEKIQVNKTSTQVYARDRKRAYYLFF